LSRKGELSYVVLNCLPNKDVICYVDVWHHLDLGDYFRSLWGPFAGWAQAVSLSLT